MSFVSNKTLILTGASSGLGRALALELARSGASLVLNARRKDRLEETAEQCAQASTRTGSPASHALVAGNAADPAVADALMRAALELGEFEGFIHCAGVLAPGPSLWELPEEDFDAVFDAGPTAAHRLARACLPHLLRQGHGLAVFVGSGAAERAQPGIAAYCAAKAALEHMARLVAAEAPKVTSFVYRPGIVDTAMQDQARESRGGGAEALRAVFVPWKEQGQLLTPRESAAALVAILTREPRRFQGKTATVRDGLEAAGTA